MKTVLTGTHHPEKPQPKRVRRSPKKRRSEKSEVATPEFGTISSAEPSHGKPTGKDMKAAKPDIDLSNKKAWGNTDIRQAHAELAADTTVYVAHREYQRELTRARSRKQQWLDRERTNAMRAGFAVGSVIGLIVGLGLWWLSVLFS